MDWKKLLDTKDLIAYEKSTKDSKIRIEARLKNGRWRIYKTHYVPGECIASSRVKEYIAASRDEATSLLYELQKEGEKQDLLRLIKFDMARSYKEDFVEKWKFKIDDFNEDNFLIVRFDSEIKLDVVLHERYNALEKQILEKLVLALGLKDISHKIRYDFFYFKRHSGKCRIYEKQIDKDMVAKLEFNINNMG